MDPLTFLGLAAVTLLCIFMYLHYTKRRRLGFDGPTPWPIVGSHIEQLSKGVERTDKEWEEQYGPVYGYYSGLQLIVVITDPEMLKTVMVKEFPKFMNRPSPKSLPRLLRNGLFFMEGRKWKKTRNILTPAFSAGKLKLFSPILNKCAKTLTTNMEKKIGEEVDIRKFFIHFTMDAIASTAFGIDVDSQNQPDDPFVANIDKIFKFGAWRKAMILLSIVVPYFGKIMSTLKIHTWPKKEVAFYERTGQMLIDEKKKNKKNDHVDFIQMLLEAEFDSSKAEHVQNGFISSHDISEKKNATIERLTDDEINGQAFVFFLAGFETTASTLRYSSYILALHPEVDEKLYDEMVEKIQDEEPTYDNIANLKYMDMFISEVLRFYPPVNRLSREVQEDVVLDGRRIPKGTFIAIPVWRIHHNPQYYPDPETFDPERFSDHKGTSTTDGITYLPFGAGPRHCIGMRLALVETKIALVHILRKIRFVRCEKTEVPLKLNHIGVLQPKSPVFVRLERR